VRKHGHRPSTTCWALPVRHASTLLVLLTTCCTGLLSWAASGENEIFVGEGYAFGVSRPEGWVGVKPDFAPVLFHPAGSTVDSSLVVIYVRPVSKSKVGVTTPAQLNALDLRGMRTQWPNARSAKGEVLRTRAKTSVPTYSFTGGKYLELVAYVDHPKTITVIVLSAETKETFASSTAAFRHVVSSYQWLPELASSR
jgi:hypothetical protein